MLGSEAVQSINVPRLVAAALFALAALAHSLSLAAATAEQFVPLNFYWVGPYAAGGSGIAAGMVDYLQMLNERDGGIHGVKFTWERCDTQYDNARGIACYERAKNHRPGGATLVHPLSTGITYSLIERASEDRIPVVSIGYGRPDAADGTVFPYVFPLVTTYWDQAAAMVRYVAERSGGVERLRGKRITLLYHDSAYGREPIPVLSELAEKYGYTLSTVAVANPGEQQDAQWQRIQKIRPDWIILWGWGAMNPAALKYAARIDFPRSRMLGVWWSGAEEDVSPAGRAAHGFIAAAFNMPGTGFPVIQDIRSYVYGEDSGAPADGSRIGSIYYNRGVVFGILTAEAVRLAQEHFGAGKPITSEQARWGLEHLDLDAARLKALGAEGLMPTLETSCADHEGSGFVRFLRWDGRRWRPITDWVAPLPEDRAAVRRMSVESAKAYAKGKGITPRRCPDG